jgi:hypothetical protein
MSLKEKWLALKEREAKKMENMTFKQKVQYITGNWGLEIVVAITVLAVAILGIYMLDNATNVHIITVGLVDTDLTEKEMDVIRKDFKAAVSSKSRKEVVSLEPNIASFGGTLEEVDDYFVYENQQQSILLVMSGVVDCYLCPQSYVDFLKECDVLMSVKDAIGEELAAKYASAATEDGLALRVTSEAAEEYFTLQQEENFLVFTTTPAIPEMVREFTTFVMEK